MADIVVEVVVTVVVLGTIAVLGWLVGGGRTSVGNGVVVLRYGVTVCGLAVIAATATVALLGLMIACLFGIGPGKDEPLAVLGCLGMAGTAALYFCPEGFRRRVVLSDSGLTTRGWFGWSPLMRWDEVRSVKNRVLAGAFEVRSDAAKIQLSHYLAGIEVFIAECKRRLAPEVYTDAFEKPLSTPFG